METNQPKEAKKMDKKKITTIIIVACLLCLIALLFIILACCGVFDKKQNDKYSALQFDLNLPNGEETTTEIPDAMYVTGGGVEYVFSNLPSIENTLNYNFIGWKSQAGSVIYASGETFNTTSDSNTLYAVWEGKSRTILIKGILTAADKTTTEIETPIKTIETNYGSTITLSQIYPNTITEDDYIFDGYYTNKELTGDKILGSHQVTFGEEQTVLYANYKEIRKTIIINFNLNGATGTIQNMNIIPDKNNTYTFTEKERAEITSSLKKDGHDLVGFSQTPDGEGSWTITLPDDTDEELTLYAVWEAQTRTIIINGIVTAVDGTITELEAPIKTIETKFGETLTLNPVYTATLAEDDYEFDGYYTNNELTGDKIIGSYQVTFEEEQMILYANYKQIRKITIEFDSNGGTGTIPKKTIIPGSNTIYTFTEEEQEEIGSVFTFQGYDLIGLSRSSDGEGSWSISFEDSDERITLYAVWEAKARTIIIKGITTALDGTTSELEAPIKTIETKFGETITLSPIYTTTLTEDEYNFDGYYTSNELTGDKIIGSYQVTFEEEQMILYANYNKIRKITIEFDSNGATGTISNKMVKLVGVNTTYTFTKEEQEEIKSAFTFQGYDLMGLSRASDGEGSWSISFEETDETITLYAIWVRQERIVEIRVFLTLDGVTSELETPLDSIHTTYGSTITLEEEWPTYCSAETHEFDGYYLNKSLTGDKILGSYQVTCEEEKLIVYIHYKEKPNVTIEFDSNGGTGFLQSKKVMLDDNNSYTFTEEEQEQIRSAFTREGYDLMGLSLTPDGEESWTIAFEDTGETSRPLTSLYVIWEAIFTHSEGVVTGLTEYGQTFSSLTIPSTLDSEEITSIGEAAFRYCTKLSEITIPNGVISIEDYAFMYCTKLSEITIPNSVISIGDAVFMYCYKLSEVILPDGLENMGDDVFAMCDSLTSIAIPNSVTSMGAAVFKGCTNLSEIILPDSLASINRNTFYQCESLESIVLPNDITSIGEAAFQYCSNLSEIIIPDSVVSIVEYAFEHCGSLTSIAIPNSVTYIGASAFRYCSNLSWIILPNSVELLLAYAFASCTNLATIYYEGTSDDWDLMSVGSSNTDLITADRYYYSVDLPPINDDVTDFDGNYWHYIDNAPSIWDFHEELDKMFTYDGSYNYTSITGLTDYGKTFTTLAIPSQIKDRRIRFIDDHAFQNNSNLESVTISGGIDDVGNYAFYNCQNITSFNILNGVTHFGEGAFNSCSSITSFTIPDSVYIIEGLVFAGCTNLESIHIGKNLVVMGENVFLYCSSLASMTADENNYMFKTKILGVECNGIIANDTWTLLYGCKNTVIPDRPDSIAHIKNDAFSNCIDLTSFTIPSSVKTIGSGAFSSCTSLESINLPNSLQSIGEFAFAYCTSLTSVTIPSSITSIEGNTFDNCINLASVTIPSSVTSIGDYAFSHCESLESIDLNNVTSIGYGAFVFCTNLQSVIIPEGVSSIEYNMFHECEGLERIYYKGTSYAEWMDDFQHFGITIYYYSEDYPSEPGNYWHDLGDGTPEIWQ